MTDEGASRDDPLATVTHARLRASQGDRIGAARLLRRVLATDPGNATARSLLYEISPTSSVPSTDPRIERLERWLRSVQGASRSS